MHGLYQEHTPYTWLHTGQPINTMLQGELGELDIETRVAEQIPFSSTQPGRYVPSRWSKDGQTLIAGSVGVTPKDKARLEQQVQVRIVPILNACVRA